MKTIGKLFVPPSSTKRTPAGIQAEFCGNVNCGIIKNDSFDCTTCIYDESNLRQFTKAYKEGKL